MVDLEVQVTNKPTILVDFDDVMNNLFPNWVKYLNEKYDLNVDYTMCRGWEMKYHFPTLTDNQIFDCLHEKEFWDNVSLRLEAVNALKKLHDEGYEIYIVTSSSFVTMKIKWERFFEYDPNNRYSTKVPTFLHHNVISTNNKHLIKGDVLIDDGLHNLVGGEYRKILFTAEHNKEFDYLLPSLGVRRASNWDECYKLVHELVPIK